MRVETTRDGQIRVWDPEGIECWALTPAAALELAERLRAEALKIQAEDENAFTALHGH